MKKHWMKTLLAVLLLIVLAEGIALAVMLTPSYAEIGEASAITAASPNDLRMISQTLPKQHKLKMQLDNYTDHTIRWDYGGTLEIWHHGSWHTMNKLFEHGDHPSVSVAPETFSGTFYDWEDEYGDLRPGKYRFIPNLTRIMDDAANEPIYIAAEFAIK